MNTTVIKDYRKKVEDRDEFTYEERKKIALKSHDRCCHCGKLTYFGYGATVDHFVPISRGGTNDDKNLVMLCMDCNKEKGHKILGPELYLKYIDDKYLREVDEYFDNYLDSFEYIERNNILACDEYGISVLQSACEKALLKAGRRPNKKKIDIEKFSINYLMKRATEDDKERLEEYLYKYLVKRDSLDDKDSIKDNIAFWLKYGCIYYLENSDGIHYMAAFTARSIKLIENDGYKNDKDLCLLLFPEGGNSLYLTITTGIVDSFLKFICREQKLLKIPVQIMFLKAEPLASKFFYIKRIPYSNSGDFCFSIVEHWFKSHSDKKNKEDLERKADNALNHFFDKFKDIENEMTIWGKKNPDISWMSAMLYMTVDLRSEEAEVLR